MFIILNTILKCVSMERSQNTHLSAWIISFINESHLHKVPKKMRRHCKHCWYSVSAYSNVCVHKHKQGRSRCITLSQFTVPPRLYILLKSFPRALSSHSSTSLPSHPACHPFFFSCLCHNLIAPCCNFSISIFHLIFPQQRATSLNYLAPPEI